MLTILLKGHLEHTKDENVDIVVEETDTDHATGSEDSHNLGETGGVETAAEFVLSRGACDVAR